MLDSILGLLLPLLIAFLGTWKMITWPGFIMWGDTTFLLFPSIFFSQADHAWSWYYSSPTGLQALPNLLFFMIPYLLTMSAELSQKIWMLISYALVGVFAYFAMRIWLSKEGNEVARYGACVVFSLCYMVNIYALTLIGLPTHLQGYYSLPLLIALYAKTLWEKEHVLRNTAVIALLLSLSVITFPFFPITLLVILALWLHKFLTLKKEYALDFKKHIMLVTWFVLFNSYWIFPSYLVPSSSDVVMSSSMSPFRFNLDELRLGRYGRGFDLIHVLTLNLRYGGPYLITRWSLIIGFIIPVVAFASLLLYKRKEYLSNLVLYHAILFIIASLLTVRSDPFVNISALLGRYLFSEGSWWAFIRNPAHFVPLLCYTLAFLTGMFVYGVLSKLYRPVARLKVKNLSFGRGLSSLRVMHLLSAIFLISISSLPWITYTSFPVSGDVGGYFTPISVPQEYYEANSWLREQEGFHRVWWLPPTYEFQRFAWAPEKPLTLAWAKVVSSKPILPSSEFVDYLYMQEILEGKSNNLGKILLPFAVKYIALPMDKAKSQWIAPNLDEQVEVFSSLAKQKDLELAYNKSFMYLFKVRENFSAVYAASKLAVIVGGFDVYTSLTELDGFDPGDYAIVFSEQISAQYLKRVISVADVVFFSRRKGLEDLYLQLAESDFVYPSRDYECTPSGSWSVSSSPFVDLHVQSLRSEKHFVQEGDFLYGGFGVSASTPNATLNIILNAKALAMYELWVRVLRNPFGETLSIYVDGSFIKDINTYSSSAFFRWEKVSDVFLEKGSHVITLQSKGTNFVNALLLEDASKLQEMRKTTLELLQGKRIVSVERNLIAVERKLDQEQGVKGAWGMFGGDSIIGQTFTPEHPSLVEVEFWIHRKSLDAGNLIVELHRVNKDGLPASHVLSNVTLPSEKIPYPAGPPTLIELRYKGLSVGEQYTLILREEGEGVPGHYVAARSNDDRYERGSLIGSNDGGKIWVKGENDLVFTTYYLLETKTNNLKGAKHHETALYEWDVLHSSLQKIDELPPTFQAADILDFAMPFSGKYLITINATTPFVLVIPETYDPSWKVNNMDYSLHLPILGSINGFYINKTGRFQVVVEYTINTPFEVGKWISILSLSVLLTSVTVMKLRPSIKDRTKRHIRYRI